MAESSPQPSAAGGVWVNPKDPFDKVLIVSGDAVLFANPDADKLEPALNALRTGDENAPALLGKAKGTPLAAITKVSSNLKGRDVGFNWGKGKDSTSKNFTTVNDEQREQILGAMVGALGAGWRRTDTQYGVGRAALGPVVSALVVGGLTFVLWMAAKDMAAGQEAETHGRRVLLKKLLVWVLDLIGPTGVLVVGGLIVLLLLVWTVKRVKNPPLMAVIKRG